MNTTTSSAYNYKVVRQFAIMTVVWGIVGMLVGVLIAAQLVWPQLNLDIPWLTYGRLRPLHTNAVIFAFGGCALFATCYYSVQRTCQTTLFAPSWPPSLSGAGNWSFCWLPSACRWGSPPPKSMPNWNGRLTS